MESFSDFTQEKYDKLKIFLITNFNLMFQPSSKADVVETFEIVIKHGKIIGHYHKNSNLELLPSENTDEEYNKIVGKIKELSNNSKVMQEKKPEAIDTEKTAQEMMVKEYANNSRKFYEHILDCETCRRKLAEIWKHLYE